MRLNNFLDNRLYVCAKMVENNSKIADVGTDHAYLPIYLVLSGKIQSAIATDINPLPLKKAEQNIKKYGLENQIRLILSDGLKQIFPDKADTIIIAGMGGELIANIIENAEWSQIHEKKFILQPMSKPERLREFLLKNKFQVITEKAVTSNNKIYSVMKVNFNKKGFTEDVLHPYIGKITKFPPESLSEYEAVLSYIDKVINSLNKRLKGYKIEKNKRLENITLDIILKLEKERQKYYDLYKKYI